MRNVIAVVGVLAVTACGKEGGGIGAGGASGSARASATPVPVASGSAPAGTPASALKGGPMRSVDPNASWPIASSEVDLTVGTRHVPATIVAPTEPGTYPALLLFAGSGPTDRDWNSPLLPNKNGSGKLLAEALAAHGMVVIRWDKAGSGKNPGPALADFTLDSYRDEGAAAFEALRARPDVRADAIFVAGHSEGGIHATRLAALEGDQIRGVVFLSAAGRRMVDIMAEQLTGNFRDGAHMTPDQIAAQMKPIAQAFDDFLAGKPVDPTQASPFPPVQQLVTQITRPETATLARALFGFDPAGEAGKLPQSAFFVGGGGRDVQVDPNVDGGALVKALKNAHKDVTYQVSPEMDHVLKHEPRDVAAIRADLAGTQAAYNAPGRTLDSDFVNALVAWLAAHSAPAAR